MIAELVCFSHPEGATRADILDGALASVAQWQASPDLLRKHYLLGDDGRGAGFYLWPSREAADRGHSPEWIAEKERQTGARVTIHRFELLLTLDNQAGTLTQP